MFTIRVPVEMKLLNAHARGHWSDKTKPTAMMRTWGKMEALQLKNTGTRPLRGFVIVDYTFFVPDSKRRDRVNMMQSCKPVIDGVCDSKMVEGDHWEAMGVGKVKVLVDRSLKSVEVEITLREGSDE